MSASPILTMGLGAFSDVNHLVTLGLGTGATPPPPVPPATRVGGHGSEDGENGYSEPRRVIIAGKPYTVRSRAEYLALLRKFGRKDVPRETKQPAQEQAEAVIARAQETARESLSARQTAEIAALLHAKLKAQAAAGALDARAMALRIEEGAIPIELLMLMAADL